MDATQDFKKYLPSGFGIFYFIIGVPAVFLAALIIAYTLPDGVYYSVLRYLPFILLVGIYGFGLKYCVRFINARSHKAVRVISRIVLGLLVVGVALPLAGGAMFGPRKFNTSDGYCEDKLIAKLERCEGTDRGILQGRISAVARFGEAVPNLNEVIQTYPDFSLFQINCPELSGGFGERCYTGQFLRETGDTNFLGVYITKTKVLVVETENIPLAAQDEMPHVYTKSNEANAPEIIDMSGVYAAGRRDALTNFVDLTRFADEMSP